jgi:hypothetical protein
MENGKNPASPIANSEGFVTHQSSLEKETQQQMLSGLTKREYFAAMAMQGWIANQQDGYTLHPETIAMRSAQCADALLAELEYSQEGQ